MPRTRAHARSADAFATSNKRSRSEDASDHEDGAARRQKRGRRDALPLSARQSTLDVEFEDGACWRCKLLRLPCGSSSPCYNCRSTNRALQVAGYPRALGCHRIDLQDRLRDKFPSLPGFGHEEWYLPTRAGFTLRIRVKYDDPSMKIGDIDLSNARRRALPEFKESIVKFLKQFHDLKAHWGMYYEAYTEDIIRRCAEIQEDIIQSRSPTTQENFPEEDLVIALALKALALAHYYPVVTCSLPFIFATRRVPPDTFQEPEIIQGPEEGGTRSVEIWRCPSVPQMDTARPEQDGGERLSSMIQDIVRVTQKMLLRRRPEDWPAIFCVLCLLKLIQSNLSFTVSWVNFFNAGARALDRVWSILCQLYHVSTKGQHPLTCTWDPEEYAKLVHGDARSVEHFRSFNEMWVDDEWREYDDDNLQKKMDRFLAGYDTTD